MRLIAPSSHLSGFPDLTPDVEATLLGHLVLPSGQPEPFEVP